MTNTYHVATRQTYDARKDVIGKEMSFEAASGLLKGIIGYGWVKTGLVWTMLSTGCQACVEDDSALSIAELKPYKSFFEERGIQVKET